MKIQSNSFVYGLEFTKNGKRTKNRGFRKYLYATDSHAGNFYSIFPSWWFIIKIIATKCICSKYSRTNIDAWYAARSKPKSFVHLATSTHAPAYIHIKRRYTSKCWNWKWFNGTIYLIIPTAIFSWRLWRYYHFFNNDMRFVWSNRPFCIWMPTFECYDRPDSKRCIKYSYPSDRKSSKTNFNHSISGNSKVCFHQIPDVATLIMPNRNGKTL